MLIADSRPQVLMARFLWFAALTFGAVACCGCSGEVLSDSEAALQGRLDLEQLSCERCGGESDLDVCRRVVSPFVGPEDERVTQTLACWNVQEEVAPEDVQAYVACMAPELRRLVGCARQARGDMLCGHWTGNPLASVLLPEECLELALEVGEVCEHLLEPREQQAFRWCLTNGCGSLRYELQARCLLDAGS